MLRQIKWQVRPFRQLAKVHELEQSQSLPLSRFLPHLRELQANRSGNQSEIAKLSVFYRNLSVETLSASKDHLNNALYFSSLFMKPIPMNLVQVAQERVEMIETWVLRALAQKLLTVNQWPTAEKLINKKFQGDPSTSAIMKFEVFALNGNYRKMIEHLSVIAQTSSIPQSIQFRLICLLNSKDGKMTTSTQESESIAEWGELFQIALKGRILSADPPTMETFIQLIEPLSCHFEVNSSLMALGFTKCFNKTQNLRPETLKLLKLVYRRCSVDNLIALASRLNTTKQELNEDVVIALLERICKNPPVDLRENVLSSLLCWIIRFCPEKYSLSSLMSEFGQIIDSNVARHALEACRLHDENCIKFIEFCVVKRGIHVERETVKETVDIASERDGFAPSTEFLRHIHQNGYNLSSKFYLKLLISSSYSSSGNVNRAYECFKVISAHELHGELLQKYLKASQDLMERCLEHSILDYCHRIHQSTLKYQILRTLSAPKSFKEFILDNFKAGKFTKPFSPTHNLECIRTALDCAQTRNSKKLSEIFCVTALQAALTNLDFSLAQRLSVYMRNQSYNHCDSCAIQNILLHWSRRIQNFKSK